MRYRLLALRALSAHLLQTDSTHLAAGRRHQPVRQALQGLAGARGDRRFYDVLGKLAGNWPHQRLDELLPAQWKTLHAKPAPATLATPI
jgi:hypothetical protein